MKMATKTKTETTTNPMETMATVSNETVKENFEKAMKGFNDVTAFNRDLIEAFVTAANAATKNAEAFGSETVGFAKQSFDDTVSAAKAAMTSRSVQELVEINTDYTKSAFDAYLGQVNKMNDMMIAAAKDTTEPLAERFSAFAELCQSYRP
ncbi:MAG: hypothetical protein Tsb0010_12660 [Parvularculaceae bacterium]